MAAPSSARTRSALLLHALAPVRRAATRNADTWVVRSDEEAESAEDMA